MSIDTSLMKDDTSIFLQYLNYPDVQALAMTDAEIIAAVESGLMAQGMGQAVIEPRMHLVPEKDYPGHFNVLRGYKRAVVPLLINVTGLWGVGLLGGYGPGYVLVALLALTAAAALVWPVRR
jgi:ornithine cyclodeaminase